MATGSLSWLSDELQLHRLAIQDSVDTREHALIHILQKIGSSLLDVRPQG